MVPQATAGAARTPTADPDGRRVSSAAMLLALDIGNTNVTLGLFRAGRPRSRRAGRRPTRAPPPTSSRLLLDGAAPARRRRASPTSTAIALASVVPALTGAVERSPHAASVPSSWPAPGPCRSPIRVDRPSEVGADRLVNALAAARLYGTPAVVVDFGTATTFDCVAADGAYVGGAIAPGLELGLEALATRTAKLPRIELRAPDRAIGRDTVTRHAVGRGPRLPGPRGRAARRGSARELADANEVAPSEVKAILTGGLSAAPWAEASRASTPSTPT